MRPIVVLSLLACSLFSTPAFAAWDIFQSYVIIDAGSGNQFLAGGYNADVATAFDGSDLGTFAASDALTLNGGELKTYKNGSSNVCGGNVYYRVYASGDTPGSFSSVALTNASNLTNPGDQKWDGTAAGVDLLAGLTAGGAYTLEVYWDLTGAESDLGGCGETKYDSDFGNNFTASFTFNVPGCTDPDFAEYDAAANTDDSSCATPIDPCDGALVLGSVSVTSIPTAIDAADGAIDIDVTTGTAIALDLTGINGAGDYSFSLPGAMDGILAGTYDANAEDAGGCNSNTVSLIVPYAQCCNDCGVYDVDTDGICDDSDNCTNRSATNYNDPANEACIIPGCTSPGYLGYDPEHTVDDGSCGALAVPGCTDSLKFGYNSNANLDDGSCGCYLPGEDPTCVSPDMGGYTYDVVSMGCQCWFAENLRTTYYRNGDQPSSGLTETQFVNHTEGALTHYGEGELCITCANSSIGWTPGPNSYQFDACIDDSLSLEVYGHLYNGYAVEDARGLCPSGWHVSTRDEWVELKDFVENTLGHYYEGNILNAQLPSSNGNDMYGFGILPGGTRESPGNFKYGGDKAYFWTTDFSIISLFQNAGNLVISSPGVSASAKQNALSVRCLMDADFISNQGCTDPAYLEFDSTANTDDGSCTNRLGCTDPTYLEYDAEANVDDGSCTTQQPEPCLGPSMDGYNYNVVRIGDQCWFAENLRTTLYADGSVIPAGFTDGDWVSTTSGATAVYGESSGTCQDYSPDIDPCDDVQSLEEYGRLYNWYAVDDARGLCPSGWHVPTDGEWTVLEDYLLAKCYWDDARALQTTYGWNGDNNGTDDFGFSALPGGERSYYNGYFYDAGTDGFWWSSTPNNSNGWRRYIAASNPDVGQNNVNPGNGNSVRCLKD